MQSEEDDAQEEEENDRKRAKIKIFYSKIFIIFLHSISNIQDVLCAVT